MKKKILLAEDSEIFSRRLLTVLPGMFGDAFDFDHAVDGDEVTTCLEKQKYELIIMDIDMPWPTQRHDPLNPGDRLTHKLRDGEFLLNSQTPVIIESDMANSTISELRRLLALPAVTFVHKAELFGNPIWKMVKSDSDIIETFADALSVLGLNPNLTPRPNGRKADAIKTCAHT